jgi:hypothetical protein
MATEPVHVIRFGLILCEIFQQQTRAGERFTVSLTRLYRNGSVWTRSKVLGRDDLLAASKALWDSHSWIFERCQSAIPRGETEEATHEAKE